ncbi:MAG: hypothetical protein ACLR1V_05745 [Coprococcus sp.]
MILTARRIAGRGLTFPRKCLSQYEASGLCHRRHYTGESASGGGMQGLSADV